MRVRRFALLLFVCLLAGCSAQSLDSAVAQSLTREQALAEVAALQAPAGANPQQFAALKSALTAALQHGSSKFTAAVANSAVDDLTLTMQGGTSVRLDWTYRNKGDYDQNRQVTISDLSALGANLGKSTASPDWLSKARVCDGDNNGEVNISDITPIGANLLATVSGYKIQTTTTPGTESSWNDIDEAAFETSAIGGAALRVFTKTFAASPNNWYRVVAFDGSERGAASNAVQFALQAPNITSASPTSGEAGIAVGFSATNIGGTPTTWSWDFGGGATPNTSTLAAPPVTLGAAGVYDASVTASNPGGSDTFNFTLTVTNPAPPQIDDVQPQSGTEGAQVGFIPTLSGGPVATYAWDFGGGAAPNTDTTQFPSVTLGTMGIYPASLTVTNAGGSDTFNFNLTITPPLNNAPTASFTATPQSGSPGDPVLLDASGSSDSDGSIVKYEWDLDGVAGFEVNGGASPTQNTTLPNPAGSVDVSLRVTDNGNAQDTFMLTLSSFDSNPVGPIAVDSGANNYSEITMLVVNGNPAMVYAGSDSFSTNIYFVRATTADGSIWSSPQELATSVRNYSSFQIINGVPAITYAKDIGGDLMYRHADDPGGSSWAPAVVGKGASGGQDMVTKLLEVNGRPGFFFVGSGMFFRLADDASGDSWGTTYGIDFDDCWNDNQIDAKIVNGKPALVYTVDRNGNGELTAYVQAANADGTAWNPPVDVLPTGGGHYTWMVDAGGNPAIFESGSNIRYVRALDPDGSAWDTMQLLPINPSGVEWTARSPAGLPTVAYYSSALGGLSMLQASDAQGSAWDPPTLLTASTSLAFPSEATVMGGLATAYRTLDAPATVWYYKAW